MTRGLLYWIILIFLVISLFIDSPMWPKWGSYGIVIIELCLIGWDVYGPALRGRQ